LARGEERDKKKKDGACVVVYVCVCKEGVGDVSRRRGKRRRTERNKVCIVRDNREQEQTL
jgi:hypothetical protein